MITVLEAIFLMALTGVLIYVYTRHTYEPRKRS